MPPRPAFLGLICLSALTACPAPSSAGDIFASSASTAGAMDDGADTSTTGAGEDATTQDQPGPLLDMQPFPDLPADSCGKVDLLFVIDASGSMGVHQQALLEAYPQFIDGLADYFADVDFHVGVVSSDTYAQNPDDCQKFGALVTQVPNEDYSELIDCQPFASGARYLDEADLESKFACVARLGAAGDTLERPASAAVAALYPHLNAEGACNAGFLRDDALLVVVMISNSTTGDESGADANPAADPSGWYPSILAAKGGHPENAVAIGFVASGDTWCIPNGYDGLQAPNLISFIEDFGGQGVLANVCDEDYGPVFTEAIDVVLGACESFVPPR